MNSTIAAQSITRHPRKAKQTGRPNQPFVRVHLHSEYGLGTKKRPPEQVFSGLWLISPHSGQSSQLSLERPFKRSALMKHHLPTTIKQPPHRTSQGMNKLLT